MTSCFTPTCGQPAHPPLLTVGCPPRRPSGRSCQPTLRSMSSTRQAPRRPKPRSSRPAGKRRPRPLHLSPRLGQRCKGPWPAVQGALASGARGLGERCNAYLLKDSLIPDDSQILRDSQDSAAAPPQRAEARGGGFGQSGESSSQRSSVEAFPRTTSSIQRDGVDSTRHRSG